MDQGQHENGTLLLQTAEHMSTVFLLQSLHYCFKRAACGADHHSLPAGRIAEDPANCAAIAQEVGAIQQLILMALSDNEVVVEQACKVIGMHVYEQVMPKMLAAASFWGNRPPCG